MAWSEKIGSPLSSFTRVARKIHSPRRGKRELDCGWSAGLSPPDSSEVRQAGEARDDGKNDKCSLKILF